MAATEYNATTNQLFSVAQAAIGNASLIAGRISGSGRPSLKETRFSHTVAPLHMDAPPKFSDLFAGASNTDAVIAGLNDKVDAWLAKYFPAINGDFQSLPENWCVGVLSGVKPFGVDSTVFDLVWHKARDRAYRTASTERRTLAAAFGARGFTLPPGAMVDAMTQAEQRATDAILDVSRDQAVKDADIKADILKHAASISAQLKTSILNTSAEFYKSYFSVYGLDNDTARIRAQAYQSYHNALSNYHGVEVAWENLRMNAAEKKAGIDGDIDRTRVSAYSGNGAAGAHAQASRGFADIAAQSANAASSLVASIENI